MNEPKPGTRWQHRNGNLYTVLLLANRPKAPAGFPRTVVFYGEGVEFWSMPESDWHLYFTPHVETRIDS